MSEQSATRAGGAPVRTWGVVVLVAALSFASSVPAVGRSAAPSLSATPPSAAPATQLEVTGNGFRVRPSTCELRGLGRSWPCELSANGAYGELDLASADGLEAGSYEVQACVPTCEQPWAGVAEGTLVVTDPPPPPVSDPQEPATDVFGRPRPRLVTASQTLRLVPPTAVRGSRVVANAAGLPISGQDRTCELTWDGTATDHKCGTTAEGALRGSLRVPAKAAPGPHVLRACVPTCGRQVDVEDSTRVVVLAVPMPPTTLPRTPSSRAASDDPSRSTGPTTTDSERAPTSRPPPTATRTTAPATPAPAPTTSTVEVPKVIGATLEEAEQLLGAVGLTVGRTRGTGRVFRQDPRVGAPVPVGTPVHLELREDPPPPPVEVPDLTDLTVERAQDVLGPLGLALDDPPPADAVITDQDPPPGTEVPPASLVRVEVDGGLGWVLVLAAAALVAGVAASWGRSRWKGVHPSSASVRPVADSRPVVGTQVLVPGPRLPPLQVLSTPDADPIVTTSPGRPPHDDHG